METPDVMAQYRLFTKYYNNAYENCDLADYQTADQLRRKVVPKIEDLFDGETTTEFAGLFEMFSEFLFEYYRCLRKHKQATHDIEYELKSMAQKVIQLNGNSFWGHFFLAVHHSFNLTNAHSGSGSAIHKGRDTVETIIGTTFKLLGKGLTLAGTSVSAGISKSNFTNSVKRVIETYQLNLAQKPCSAKTFFKMTEMMFMLAEVCEEVNNPIWKDVYTAIKNSDVHTLDYSEFDDYILNEIKESAIEMILLADAKI